ncbi:MAG: prepilin peptidase [Myxococcaceae bacterium]
MNASFSALPAWIPAAWLFVLGSCVGSFLNVVIARLPEGASLVKPRSRCPKCGHQLSWFENIPLFSWLALRGKCRNCKAPISVIYPAVELLTALLFLAALHRFDWDYPLLPALLLICLLVPLTFIDLAHWILPHEVTIPGIVVGLLVAIPLGWPHLRDCAIGAAAGFGAFWAMEWVGEKIFKKEALGGGDKFLLALLGAFLTWRALLGIIFLSSLQGSIVGVTLILLRGRAGPAPEAPPEAPAPAAEASEGDPEKLEDDWVPGPTNIPFGPWLALAALEILLFGGSLARFAPGLTGDLLGFGG